MFDDVWELKLCFRFFISIILYEILKLYKTGWTSYTLQKRTQLATRYEVWKSVVQVQR